MGALNSAHMAWDFLGTASTGALKAVNMRGVPERFTGYFETGPGCTATVRWESRCGSSSGVYGSITASTAMATGAMKIEQFAGPLEWVRPYCVAKTTGTLSATLFGN